VIVLVANPTSGGGRCRRLIPEVLERLQARGEAHRVVITEDGGHPRRAALEAAEGGADVVVAMGGDGLVGSCADALVGTETALAVVPAGSGNDFATHLGLDTGSPASALEVLWRGGSVRIDVVRAEGPGWERHYVCVAGAGFDSEANDLANRVHRLHGTAKYVYAALRTLVRFRPADLTIRVDGDESRLRGMLIAVGNASSYGGGMKVCPDASLEDGLADVCVVEAMWKLRFLATFPKVFKGRHVGHPKVTMLRGAKVEVESSRPFEVYADGEPMGPLPASFTVVPRALKVFTS